ncbi:MAG: hypothetical protein JWN44_2409 [Myxococcales bacterium]|nr:hypothetical protein [Myxococcales bacterium]
MSGALDKAPPSPERDIAAAETLARWMDDRYLDPLLGLVIPGVGDLVGSALGLYVVGVAVKRRLPLVTVARMLVNLGVDALVGAVPLLGDLFDVAWKANRRNVALLRQRHDARHNTAGDWLRVGGALALLVAGLAAPIVTAYYLLHWLLHYWR